MQKAALAAISTRGNINLYIYYLVDLYILLFIQKTRGTYEKFFLLLHRKGFGGFCNLPTPLVLKTRKRLYKSTKKLDRAELKVPRKALKTLLLYIV